MVVFKSNIVEKGQAYFARLEKEVEESAKRAMRKSMLVGEARVKGIIEKEAYDTGRLLRSINAVVRTSPNEIRGVIGTALEYAKTIEYGRKPGSWPNLDALTKWVGRKLRQEGINTRVNVSFDELKALARTGGKPPTKRQEAYRQHLSALYLIGRKIATKGIEQKLIFKRIEDGLLAYFRNELSRELRGIDGRISR